MHPDAPTLRDVLQSAQVAGVDRLDAQMLLLHALARNPHERSWLLAHDTNVMTPSQQQALDSSLKRRLAGEPIAYITGHQEFFGLDLCVDARVLVPRADTEVLVEWTLEVLEAQKQAKVVDLGTGSGAIALSLKHTRSDLHVHAVDYSADALKVARSNAQRLQLDVHFSQGSWLSDVQDTFDAIVSNPPYIETHDHHLNALRHEPLQALVSGADGLSDIRTIITQAGQRLKPGGWLLLEHGYDQAERVRNLLTDAGFASVQSRRDLAGIERCSGGQAA